MDLTVIGWIKFQVERSVWTPFCVRCGRCIDFWVLFLRVGGLHLIEDDWGLKALYWIFRHVCKQGRTLLEGYVSSGSLALSCRNWLLP